MLRDGDGVVVEVGVLWGTIAESGAVAVGDVPRSMSAAGRTDAPVGVREDGDRCGARVVTAGRIGVVLPAGIDRLDDILGVGPIIGSDRCGGAGR